VKNTCIALIIAAAALGGCGSQKYDGTCSEEMDDLRDARGEPEEVRRVDIDRYHEHTWWYGRSGFSRTFIWDGSTGSCRTTDATFDPVGRQ
jgi:hypothetical protein